MQLRGLANNIKGIYHELLFVKEFNDTHTDMQAELYPSTSHPGSDVMIRDTETGEVLREIQLKATDNLHYVRSIRSVIRTPKYLQPQRLPNRVSGSARREFPILNQKTIVGHQFNQLDDISEVGQAISAATTSTLVAGGLRALECLNGKTNTTQAIGKTAADVTIATGTSAFVAFLFS